MKNKKVKLDVQIVDSLDDIPENLTDEDPIYFDKETFNKIVLVAKERGILPEQVIEELIELVGKQNGE